MSAAATDKFANASNGTRAVATTLTATKAGGVLSISCNALTGWPTATAVHFAIYKVNTSGVKVAGSQTDWKGIVSGTSIGSMVLRSGTDNGYAIGDTVECMPTAAWADDFVAGLTAEHSQTGAHALTSSSTITSSKVITALNDTNGNELIRVTPTTSAVNDITVANAATGAGPTISATGDDTNVDLKLAPKGTGRVVLNGAGAPANATVVTSETTSSTSYADLATVGPSVTVTIGASGIALVAVTSDLTNSGGNGFSRMSFVVSGANTQAASNTFAIVYEAYTTSTTHRGSAVYLLTGLTPGSTTFKAQYNVSANTGTFAFRFISVVPL